MRPYWVVFYDRAAGCVEAPSYTDALKAASAFGKIMQCDVLPRPAAPRLVAETDPYIMCFDPQRCKGFTSCRRPISCCE
jgi:hypothetical protein